VVPARSLPGKKRREASADRHELREGLNGVKAICAIPRPAGLSWLGSFRRGTSPPRAWAGCANAVPPVSFWTREHVLNQDGRHRAEGCMAARTLNCAVSNDPLGAPGATPMLYKPPYPGNGGSAWVDILSRRIRGTKMEDKSKNTANKAQSTKTTTTTIKIISKLHTVDLEPEGNLFARRVSVSRSPSMLIRSDSRVSECSTAFLTTEGK